MIRERLTRFARSPIIQTYSTTFFQIAIGERTVWEADEEDQHGKRQVYVARAVTMNAELKKRRLEVF